MSQTAVCPQCKSEVVVHGSTTDFVKCKRCGQSLEIIWINGTPRAIRSS